ncbi:MAG: hypothetical protein ACRET8_11465, partial [Burkholderiales bacterium]
ADLYRWIDPESGSVKYSSYAPPWFGNPASEHVSPRVEVIPASRGPTAVAPGAQARPFAEGVATLDKLRQTRRSLMEGLASREDFSRAGEGFKQQVEAYRAVSVELDKVDPSGAAARRAEAQPLIERLTQGLKAQLSPASPVAPSR